LSPQDLLNAAFANLQRDVRAHYGMGTENDASFDCSAWIWDCVGDKKHDRNTDWILADATGKQTKFKVLAAPLPGCVAVYGTKWLKGGKRKAGHVGIVVDVARMLVLDCSDSQDGPACHVQEVLFNGTKDGRKPVFCQFVG